MKQNELRPPEGAKHKRKRVGRGVGSGHGTYSCRGLKGQKSRSGGGVRPLFEGGQNPLVKRLPYKRGFTNIFRTECAIVNIGRLNVFPEGAEVTPQELVSAGIVKGLKDPVKVLGQGELTHQLVVKANKFSQTARNKIEGAGGRAEVIT
ncbi:50S ribosomal protein L15 [Dehalococcoidia bacterium]|nr:50S ribosomal protein L15 [Dehalococcoidia bacterium]MCL0078357.1 50S ribosomal protein L15 [Dehalococcoidia bacterium]MCL0089981.1 50S ribosomal protein L15 [Dehalococcoidia bacterium]MCL0093542.1 50S ribosomal protein L15 [Dehalococcoidia bacterium]